jgi:DNA-binding response OmpR family regulator
MMDIRRKVLVIDDERPIRGFLKNLLDRWGYEVEEASDGGQAIERVQQGNFDLLILDIVMPVMDGWEVLKAVKSSLKMDVPVIVLSGKSDESNDMTKGYDMGAEYYITKPFTPSQLLYGIRMVFGEVETYWKA